MWLVVRCSGGEIGRRACFRCMLPQAVEVQVFSRAPLKKAPFGVLFLCSGFGLGFLRKRQAKRRLWQGNVSSRRLRMRHLLANVFPDFTDKNNRSSGCFCLAILQSTIKKSTFWGAFFVLGIWFGLSAKAPSQKKTMAGERKLAAFAYADDK